MCGLCVLACFFVVTAAVQGDGPDVIVQEGGKAPSFQAQTADGEVWKSEDHVGRKVVVVYFYPADLTSGCTLQACEFRDHMKELEEAEVEVVGVSGDSARNHQLFTKLNSLNFPLLSDEDGKVARAFGVPVREGDSITRMVDGVERTLTRGITASRWTFIIGKDGTVIQKDTKVDAVQDCRNVLEIVRRLTADAE